MGCGEVKPDRQIEATLGPQLRAAWANSVFTSSDALSQKCITRPNLQNLSPQGIYMLCSQVPWPRRLQGKHLWSRNPKYFKVHNFLRTNMTSQAENSIPWGFVSCSKQLKILYRESGMSLIGRALAYHLWSSRVQFKSRHTHKCSIKLPSSCIYKV